jgi:hypothetical protein
MVFKSFDPIIDRSRDLSHSVVRDFCPNPRIRMQKRPKRQSHLSWDPSANLADSCDICQRLALLQFSSQLSSNIPGFDENPPRVSTGLRPTALLELPRMHAQGALILLSSPTLDYHEGWLAQSARSGTPQEKRRRFLCRANGGYHRCVSLVDLKRASGKGKATQLVPFLRQPTLEMFDIFSVNLSLACFKPSRLTLDLWCGRLEMGGKFSRNHLALCPSRGLLAGKIRRLFDAPPGLHSGS